MQIKKFNTDINYDIYKNIYYIADYAKDIVLKEVEEVVNNNNKEEKINKLESRIKSYYSIIEKMKYKGYDLTLDNMLGKIRDLIGIRLVCNNLNDVYDLVKCIKSDKHFRIIEEKDYIRNPKKSGYMSYHIIVEYELDANKFILPVKAELQIRTKEMDIWANLSHDLVYKKQRKLLVNNSLVNLC